MCPANKFRHRLRLHGTSDILIISVATARSSFCRHRSLPYLSAIMSASEAEGHVSCPLCSSGSIITWIAKEHQNLIDTARKLGFARNSKAYAAMEQASKAQVKALLARLKHAQPARAARVAREQPPRKRPAQDADAEQPGQRTLVYTFFSAEKQASAARHSVCAAQRSRCRMCSSLVAEMCRCGHLGAAARLSCSSVSLRCGASACCAALAHLSRRLLPCSGMLQILVRGNSHAHPLTIYVLF